MVATLKDIDDFLRPQREGGSKRKSVTIDNNLSNIIVELIDRSKEYNSLSDYTVAACRFLVELEMLEDAGGKFHIEYENPQHPDSVKDDTIVQKLDYTPWSFGIYVTPQLITFPNGLIDTIEIIAKKHKIKFGDVVRYALAYYTHFTSVRIDRMVEVKKSWEEFMRQRDEEKKKSEDDTSE